MKLELFELLAERPITHPSSLRSATFQQGELRLEIIGHPWWKSGQLHETGTISFSFSGLTSGNAFLPAFLDEDDDEFLEDLEISATAHLSWVAGQSSSIFCSRPIPEPLRIYGLVEKYLAESGSRRALGDVLNGGGSLDRFLEYASSNAFLLTSGPEDLTCVVAEELSRQGVPFTTIKGRARPEAPWYVSFGHTWFFCETATAEWW